MDTVCLYAKMFEKFAADNIKMTFSDVVFLGILRVTVSNLYLTLTMLWANSADDKLMIVFLIFPSK